MGGYALLYIKEKLSASKNVYSRVRVNKMRLPVSGYMKRDL